ncbi:MAG: hypothetical protein D6696_18945 [Acidobacteria bacterium]|nr:MAG: hypothetical protein D6696_18945 [Acidobacteriota bacterium]
MKGGPAAVSSPRSAALPGLRGPPVNVMSPLIHTLREDAGTHATPARVADLEALLEQPAGRRLLCAACRAPITGDRERLAIGGRHVHRRTNPAGFVFTFGCFRRAPGAAARGAPTTEHTWFPGCAWRFALCRSCGAHLGWVFSGARAFFALILERLAAEEEDADD